MAVHVINAKVRAINQHAQDDAGEDGQGYDEQDQGGDVPHITPP